MLYHRILSFVLWGTLLLVAAGCGGNSANYSLSERNFVNTATQEADTAEAGLKPADLLVDGKTPLFLSEHGPALYALDERGLPVSAGEVEFTVMETCASEGSLEWEITDVLGHDREFYFRVTGVTDGLTPVGLYLDPAYADPDSTLFKGILNVEHGIDVAFYPLSPMGISAQNTQGQALCSVEFSMPHATSESPDEQSSNLSPPHSGNDGFKHICYPYAEPGIEGVEPDAYWHGYDNHVHAFVHGNDHDRNVLDLAYSEGDPTTVKAKILVPLINIPYKYPDTEEFYDANKDPISVTVGHRLKFIGQIHGDYNVDGVVTVADISPVGQYMSLAEVIPGADSSNYNAASQASESPANPFVVPATPTTVDAGVVNLIDGSMNGKVSSPTTSRNAIVFPPTYPEHQYDDDIATLAIHFNESIDRYRITLDAQSGGAVDAEVTLDYYDKDDPYALDWGTQGVNESDEDYLERSLPLYVVDFTQTERDSNPDIPSIFWSLYGCRWFTEWKYDRILIKPGTYNISITPISVLGEEGESTEIANYTLTNVLPTPPTTEAPVWYQDDGQQPPNIINGVEAAYPSSDTFRSVILKYALAREPNTHAPATSYRAYYVIQSTAPNDFDDPEIVLDTPYNPIYDTGDGIIEITAPDSSNHNPGDYVGVVVEGYYNGQWTSEDDLAVCWTRLSYDPSRPFWEKPGETEPEVSPILRVSYGVNPDGEPGYMVYYAYASDLETGISEYRIYYSSEVFDDSDFDKETSPSHISTVDLNDDANNDDLFSEIQLTKRYFFVPDSESAHLYVLIKAYNGEGNDDPGNCTVSAALTDVAIASAGVVGSMFDRLTLSYMLDPSYVCGDMAYDSSRGLGVVNATTESVTQGYDDNSNEVSKINVDAWYFDEGLGKHPIERDAWDGQRISGTESLLVDESGKVPCYVDKITCPGSGDQYVDVVDDGSALKAYFYASGISAALSAYAVYDSDSDEVDDSAYGALGTTCIASGIVSTAWHPRVYDMNSVNGPGDYMNNSLDINYDTLSWSHSNGLTYAGQDPEYVPLVSDLGNLGSSTTYQIREQYASTSGSYIDTACNQTLYTMGISTQLFTISGLRTDTYVDPNGPALYLYTYTRGDLTNNNPTISNAWYPLNQRNPAVVSWRAGVDECEYEDLVSSGGVGLPASIVYHEEDSSDVAYVLFNKNSYYGAQPTTDGLALARKIPGTSAVINDCINPYAILHGGDWETPGELYYGLSTCFGSSILDFRGGQNLTGFTTVTVTTPNTSVTSYNNLEQVTSASGVTAEQPLCFVFVQSIVDTVPTTVIPGKAVYYGEIYNYSDPEHAVCILELVDNLELIDSDYSQMSTVLNGTPTITNPTDFRPVWCSLQFIDASFNGWATSRKIPTIAYGAKAPHTVASTAHDGVLRVAAPTFFYAAASDIESGWIYGSAPLVNGEYDDVNGTDVEEMGIVELSGGA